MSNAIHYYDYYNDDNDDHVSVTDCDCDDVDVDDYNDDEEKYNVCERFWMMKKIVTRDMVTIIRIVKMPENSMRMMKTTAQIEVITGITLTTIIVIAFPLIFSVICLLLQR